MKHHLRAWRWTCPHCGIGTMPIPSAVKHLRRKHSDCLSCKLESRLCEAMIANLHFTMAVREDPFADLSRAGAPAPVGLPSAYRR